MEVIKMKVLSHREYEYLMGKEFSQTYAKVLKARIRRKVNDMLDALAIIFEHTETNLNRHSILGLGGQIQGEETVYRVLRKRQREMDMRLIAAFQTISEARKEQSSK